MFKLFCILFQDMAGVVLGQQNQYQKHEVNASITDFDSQFSRIPVRSKNFAAKAKPAHTVMPNDAPNKTEASRICA